MGKNRDYAIQYSELAMEQMRRYGIPASVTLAQAILESSNGQSELSRTCNNHFGIKATSSWLKNGGDYALFTDDKPNEKFCKYATVGDSYEHHSKFLANGSRYAACFKLAPDDYKGWTRGIERAGYATGGGYAANLQRIIEANNLQEFDQKVMQEMRVQGRSFGTENNPRTSTAATQEQTKNSPTVAVSEGKAVPKGNYSFPVKRDEFLLVTSPFGMRQDPMGSGKQMMHNGIDINCRHDDLLATENNGKVVAVNQHANTGGGKSVTIEYDRENGAKYQCTYMHMSDITVKQGDVVSAGQKIGVSGNTGTRTTGEHLHFGVKTINADGTSRFIDPAAYLAEISEKGNISLKAMSDGKDLLAKYQTATPGATQQETLAPDDWMKKLLSSEDSGASLGNSNDPIVEMAMTMYSGLLLLATQIDNKSEQEKMKAATEGALTKTISLSSLFPTFKKCDVLLQEGKPILQVDTGSVSFSHELMAAEQTRISNALGNASMSDEEKRQSISSVVSGIVASQQMSRNFEQGMEQQHTQEESYQRK